MSNDLKKIADLVDRAALVHKIAWNIAKCQLPASATDKEVSDHCEKSILTHRAAVEEAAEWLGLSMDFVDVVYAMRRCWPEALQLSKRLKGNNG